MRYTRTLNTLAVCLLSQLMLTFFATGLVSQIVDQRLSLDVEIDKSMYYSDELLLLSMRMENLSKEILTIVPMIGGINDTERDHYPSVKSLANGRMYPIQQHPWSRHWKLNPGEITYITHAFALEYQDRPAGIILAPIPAGEYAMEIVLQVIDSNIRSLSQKQRKTFTVKSIDDQLPPNTFGLSETMKKYYEQRKMKLDTAVWNAEINRLLDSSEAAPYRNTLIWNHFLSTTSNSGPQGTINAIQKSIDIALKRPNDLLPIELLSYGRRDKQYNYLYCERFREVAATGDTRLHRYFREFVCKQE